MTCNMISIIFHRHLHLLSWKNETIGAAFPADLNTTSTSRKRCADAHFLPGCLPKLAHPDRGLDGLRDRVDRPAPPIQWKKVPVSEIQDIRTSSRNAEKQCLSQKVCYQSTWARKLRLRYVTFI